jgi:hypothetical protein
MRSGEDQITFLRFMLASLRRHQNYLKYIYGSQQVVFTTKQTTFIQ